MKKITTYLFMAIAILSTSCSSNDDGPSNPTSTDTFFAKIDGADYNPPFVTGFRTSNIILLTGATGTTEEQIQIGVPDDITAGTYTAYNDALVSPFIVAYYQPAGAQDADDAGDADIGSLTITSHNLETKTIRGVFNFNTQIAVNSGMSWNITEGRFTITYSDL